MQIGDIIKDLRINKNLTQKEVADKIGISRSVLSQYENNLVEPTAGVISKLAVFFEVSAGYILGIEDDLGVMPVLPINNEFNNEEREFVELYRALSPYMKNVALDAVRAMAGKAGSKTLQRKV